MTDRINMLSVALESDVREDDVDRLVNAIKQLRGVMDVETHVADPADWLAETRARARIRDRVWQALHEEPS